MSKKACLCATSLLFMLCVTAQAQTPPPSKSNGSLLGLGEGGDKVQVEMYQLSQDPATGGMGQKIGFIVLENTDQGLKLTPNLINLPPGEHGFHIHEKKGCQGLQVGDKFIPGQAAGEHYDPEGHQHHRGPYVKESHLGDLPPLVVDEKGVSRIALLAPRLKIEDVKGLSMMVHEGGDNYSDTPERSGGGGGRIACGVIPD